MSYPTLLGIRFDAVTRPEATERFVALAKRAREEGLPAQMAVTVNVQILVNTRHRHPALRPIINNAPLVVADGAPLVLLSRLFPPKLPERVAGSDLIYDIAAAASREGLRLYFLGGTEESTVQAMEVLLRLNPELQIAGHACPMVAMSPTDGDLKAEEEICRQIQEAHTDILLVGFGNPKQELFVHRNAARLQGMAAIGLGGTFNFLSGRVRRAPRWVQRIGMEWLYRIIQEPQRLFLRYFIDAFFLAGYALAEPFRRLRNNKSP